MFPRFKQVEITEDQIWIEVHINYIVNNDTIKCTSELSIEQRSNPILFAKIRNDKAHLFATAHFEEINSQLPHIGLGDIIEIYEKSFDDVLIHLRFRDYLKDHEVKQTPSEPNEPTNFSHINQLLFDKYFFGVDPLQILGCLTSHAEGCVRDKRTHTVDAIYAFAQIANHLVQAKLKKLQSMHSPLNCSSDDGTFAECNLSNIGYFREETHYMANNPGAHMRFDDQ